MASWRCPRDAPAPRPHRAQGGLGLGRGPRVGARPWVGGEAVAPPQRGSWHEALRLLGTSVLLIAVALVLGTPGAFLGLQGAHAAQPAADAQASMYPDLGEFKRGLRANAQRCAAAHRVQYLQVMALMEAPMRVGYDRNSKCFICCMMERYETLTPDGEFLDGTMRRYAADLPDSQLKGVVTQHLDACLREGGSQRNRKSKEATAYRAVDLLLNNEDICEKCYQFAKCYYDRAKVKPDNNKKQPYQRQDHGIYQGSSGRLLQSVGNWANEQWSSAANGAQSLLSREETF